MKRDGVKLRMEVLGTTVCVAIDNCTTLWFIMFRVRVCPGFLS